MAPQLAIVVWAQLFSVNRELDLRAVQPVPLKCLQHLNVVLERAAITDFERIRIYIKSELRTVLECLTNS